MSVNVLFILCRVQLKIYTSCDWFTFGHSLTLTWAGVYRVNAYTCPRYNLISGYGRLGWSSTGCLFSHQMSVLETSQHSNWIRLPMCFYPACW